MTTEKRTAAPVKGVPAPVRGINDMVFEFIGVNDDIDKLTAKMAEKIAKIREEYDPQILAFKPKYDSLQTEIQGQAELNRAQLFPGEKKSITIGRAILAFRKDTPSIALLIDSQDKAVIEKGWADALSTAEKKYPEFIVREPDLNRSALKTADPKILKALGLKVKQGEKFAVTVK